MTEPSSDAYHLQSPAWHNHAPALDGHSPIGPDVRDKLLQLFGERFDDSVSERQRLAKTTLPRSTFPCAVVRPINRDEVSALMRILYVNQIPWHAFSRGRNWGYGDRCAPDDGRLLVDLRDMNRIIEINEELAYAVIEPGVSQGQLAAELESRGSRLMLDVTGAGPDASIVGNALQRGFGHTPYGDHYANSCNYEVVLPDGEIHRTGFGGVEASNVGHVYPYGNGPCYQGSFAQSASGVVTRMTVWLMPRPESIQGFGFKTNDHETFSNIIDGIRDLRQRGVIDSVVHLANDIRVLSSQPAMRSLGRRRDALSKSERATLASNAGIASWNGLGGLYGSRQIVKAKKRELRRVLQGICRVKFFSERQVHWLRAAADRIPGSPRFDRVRNLSRAIGDVYELLCGRPSPNHLEGAFLRNRPESGEVIDAGLIWIAPVIPFTGQDVDRLLSRTEPIANKYGFDLPITISPVLPRAAVCVANISYDKVSKEESEQATQAYREIRDAMDDLGYPPYRQASIRLHRGTSG